MFAACLLLGSRLASDLFTTLEMMTPRKAEFPVSAHPLSGASIFPD